MRNGKNLSPAVRSGPTWVTRTCFCLLLLIVSAAKKAGVEVIHHTEPDIAQLRGVRDQIPPLRTLPEENHRGIPSGARLHSSLGASTLLTPSKSQLPSYVLSLYVWADTTLTAPVRSREWCKTRRLLHQQQRRGCQRCPCEARLHCVSSCAVFFLIFGSYVPILRAAGAAFALWQNTSPQWQPWGTAEAGQGLGHFPWVSNQF